MDLIIRYHCDCYAWPVRRLCVRYHHRAKQSKAEYGRSHYASMPIKRAVLVATRYSITIAHLLPVWVPQRLAPPSRPPCLQTAT